MRGKVVMVTGATRGIGEETAKSLAAMGATVVIVGRSAERGAATVSAIQSEVSGAKVEFLCADLSSQESIRQLADEFKQRYQRLDVLVNNAGGIFMKRTETVDGIEHTWALNHLSYFLLTSLLLDTLIASAPSRIINLSSDAHTLSRGIHFDDPGFKRRYGGWRVYAQSKLANILFTRELAKRLQGTGVTANAVHPGFVATGFLRNNGLLFGILMTLARPVARSVKKGAETIIYLASSPEAEGVTGKYVHDKQPTQTSGAAHDEDAGRRLWELSEKQVANSR
ncbi:MAG: SDR family oxidoreductase [Burkholderiales bacterium]|nr:SDR family oxidoreductase [Anaerolineae bacterium]